MESLPRRTTVTLLEALVVAAVCFGLSIWFAIESMLAGFRTEPFTDANTLWALSLMLVEAALALLYLRMRGFDLFSLVPRPSWLGSAVGLALFFAAWLVGALLAAPFASSYADEPIAEIMAASRMSMSVVVVFALANGAFEEVFLLGVLLRGLRGYGLAIALGVSLLVRSLFHVYQGPVGVVAILGFGLTFSLYYVRFGQLWPPVLAHILWDIVPFA